MELNVYSSLAVEKDNGDYFVLDIGDATTILVKGGYLLKDVGILKIYEKEIIVWDENNNEITIPLENIEDITNIH